MNIGHLPRLSERSGLASGKQMQLMKSFGAIDKHARSCTLARPRHVSKITFAVWPIGLLDLGDSAHLGISVVSEAC